MDIYCVTKPGRKLLVDPEDFSSEKLKDLLDLEYPCGMMIVSDSENPRDVIVVEGTGQPVVVGVEDDYEVPDEEPADPKLADEILIGMKLVTISGCSLELFLREEKNFPQPNLLTQYPSCRYLAVYEDDPFADMPRIPLYVDPDYDLSDEEPVEDESLPYEELDVEDPPITVNQVKAICRGRMNHSLTGSQHRKLNPHKGPGRQRRRAEARSIKCAGPPCHPMADDFADQNAMAISDESDLVIEAYLDSRAALAA